MNIFRHLGRTTALLYLLCAIAGNTGASIIHRAMDRTTNASSALNLDINADGINDLRLRHTLEETHTGQTGDLWATGLNGTTLTGGGPLAAGEQIDTTLDWVLRSHMGDYQGVYYYYGCGINSYCTGIRPTTTGSWNNGARRVDGYLGFALAVSGEDLFGWASISMGHKGVATIHDLAFRSTLGVPILAGQIEPVATLAPACSHCPPRRRSA